MAVAVEHSVIGVLDFAASARGDARLNAPGCELLAEPRAVIAAIGDEMRGRWHGVEDEDERLCRFGARGS